MDARTVNDLPPAATHDGAVRCPMAIELSKKSWIVAVNTTLSDKSKYPPAKPRQSRGLYELSRSKRLLGSLARPQYVGCLKAARGYPARFVAYCSFEYVSSPIRGKSAA
jgi:transposase